MAKQTINIGTTPNDGTGDPLRSAFDKINDNFDELYGSSSFSGSYDDLTDKPSTLLASRTTKSVTTGSLANDANQNADISGFKSYALLSIETSRAAWVRIYTDAASRSADAGRSQLTDPLPDSGVIAEVITTGAEVVKISPAAIGFNFESTPGVAIPVNITNLSGSTSVVTVELTVLQLEA